MNQSEGYLMAGIWNINGIYNVNTKKITSKISFEVGQVFLARITDLSEDQKQILLKMLDGWQFSANLEKPLDYIPKGLVKFQVVGFEDGMLKISMLPEKSDKGDTDDLIEETAKKINMSIDKDDYELLKSMIKHNMPLTKDNISEVKTIIDFKNKIASDESEQDDFINNYLDSRGIQKTSTEGKKIEQFLKSFFEELKDTSAEDIFTMMENNIDITEDNIESYNKIFKGEQTIYKEIQGNTANIDNKSQVPEADVNDKNDENGKSSVNGQNDKLNEQNSKLNKSGEKNYKEVEYKNIESKDTEPKSIEPKSIESKDTEPKNSTADLKAKDLHKITADEVKNEISVKTEEMKNTIKDAIKNAIKDITDDKSNLKSGIYDKVMSSIKSNINDFKVFNTVSNQYYYMDVPLKMNGNEYGCKLLIKDERKKEKRIDSKNVKVAASVKTVNIGTVDAYLKINNNNMSVNIRCEEKFEILLEAGIKKLHNELSTLGYSIFIDVGKKQNEVSLAGCTDFFNDSKLNVINTFA